MTAQILFNQFAYTDRLSRGGFTPEQARASAEALETALSDVVATKTDITELKGELKADITELRGELKADIAELRGELKADIAELRGEFKADIAELRGEIATVRAEVAQVETRLELKIVQAKNDTLKWIFTFNLGLVGMIFAIVRFGH
jgi:ribosomal protein L29